VQETIHLSDRLSTLGLEPCVAQSAGSIEPVGQQFFVLTLALVGVVIIVATLWSGFIDRSDLPQVGVFLVLGAILGARRVALSTAAGDFATTICCYVF
jgi:hypothetical protein